PAQDAHHRSAGVRRRPVRATRRWQPAARRRIRVPTYRRRQRREQAGIRAGRRHAGVDPSPEVIELFRVRGIPVRIDAGWFVIFGLVTWSLASGYFPNVLPARSTACYWLHGALAAVLLFASVFLHELSHALAALDQDVPVGGITLHVCGGVSQLDADPAAPAWRSCLSRSVRCVC